MTRPLVSVIIPAHNAAPHIESAIESALSQTYAPIEVIVVVDGGTDATVEIVAALASADSRVRWTEQENEGVASARNVAIGMSKGELIAPLDADDYWTRTKIEAQVRRMERGGPEMGLVYSWWVGSDEAGNLRAPFRRPPMIEGDVFDALVLANFVGNASVPLIRRIALDEVGLYDLSLQDRGGAGCEDWDLALRIAEQYQVGLVPEYHVAYRDAASGMSKNYVQMERSYQLVIEAAVRRTPTIRGDILRWSESNFLLYLAGVASTRSPRASLRYTARAVALDPFATLARSVWQRAARDLRNALLGGPGRPTATGSQRPTIEEIVPPRPILWRPFSMITRRRRREALACARARKHGRDAIGGR